MLVSRIGKNRNFTVPKRVKFVHMKLGTCEKSWISRLGKIAFSRPKIKKITTIFARYLETLISRIGRYRIFRLPKCGSLVHAENLHTRSLVPFKRAFHYCVEAHFLHEK